MGGTLTRQTVCAYCGFVIRVGVPPVSHGCCVRCFAARVWDDEGAAMLTEQEIGKEQFEKAKADRARFRGIPGQAREYAAARGEQAAWRLRMLRSEPAYTAQWSQEYERDAVMLAQQAFRGWRAYRIMKG